MRVLSIAVSVALGGCLSEPQVPTVIPLDGARDASFDGATDASSDTPREAGGEAVDAGSERSKAPVPTPSFAGADLVFSVSVGGWTNQIVIAPWGDVVAITGSVARLLAREDGRTLVALDVCFTQSVDAAAFIDDTRMVLACDKEVQEISFHARSVKTTHTFQTSMSQTAVAGSRVIAGVDGFFHEGNTRVSVWEYPSFRAVDAWNAPGKVEAVALADTGKRALVGTLDGGVELRNLETKQSAKFFPKTGRLSAVGFAPKADKAFVDSGSFSAAVLDVKTAKPLVEKRTGSWLRAIRFLDDGTILATGSNGLVLYGDEAEPTRSPIPNLGEGLGLAKTGRHFCASGRGGVVACFSAKPLGKSVFPEAKSVTR